MKDGFRHFQIHLMGIKPPVPGAATGPRASFSTGSTMGGRGWGAQFGWFPGDLVPGERRRCTGVGGSMWFPSVFGMIILYLCHQKACEKNVIYFEVSILQGMGSCFFVLKFHFHQTPSRVASFIGTGKYMKVHQHTPVHAPPSQLPSSESSTASF